MVLVDVNSFKSQEVSKNNNALTDAISSLATSNEFSRDYYGDVSASLAQLHKEMREILELTGIDAKEKMNLYNRKLQRYLSLLRISEKSSQPELQPALPPAWAPAFPPPVPSANPFENNVQATPPRRLSLSSDIELPELTHNSHAKQIIQSKFRSNLPRKTPKQDILRKSAERRKVSRYDDYFTNWTPNTYKARRPKNVK